MSSIVSNWYFQLSGILLPTSFRESARFGNGRGVENEENFNQENFLVKFLNLEQLCVIRKGVELVDFEQELHENHLLASKCCKFPRFFAKKSAKLLHN